MAQIESNAMRFAEQQAEKLRAEMQATQPRGRGVTPRSETGEKEEKDGGQAKRRGSLKSDKESMKSDKGSMKSKSASKGARSPSPDSKRANSPRKSKSPDSRRKSAAHGAEEGGANEESKEKEREKVGSMGGKKMREMPQSSFSVPGAVQNEEEEEKREEKEGEKREEEAAAAAVAPVQEEEKEGEKEGQKREKKEQKGKEKEKAAAALLQRQTSAADLERERMEVAAARMEEHTFTSTLVQVTRTEMTEELHERGLGFDQDKEDVNAEILRWRMTRYTPRSLYCMTLSNPLRRRAIDLLEWRWFDRLILLTIALNCGFMASDDPLNLDPASPHMVLLTNMGILFQAIFTFEAGTKIIGMGVFMGHNTYLRDGWNCLDIFIVITGLLEFFPATGGNSSSVILRTFRLLRPLRALRAVGRFKDLRMLVELLIGCVPMLANVFGLISFIFFVFGILGVQLWGGFLQGKCYDVDIGYIHVEDENEVCSSLPGGMNPCPPGEQCLLLYTNPWFDIVSFDTIGNAMIVIFQVMVQEDWATVMYTIWDSYSLWTWVYFVVLNVVGPMFAIQLFLVVVANKYSDAKQKQNEAENAAVCLYEVKVGFVTANLPKSTKSGAAMDPYVRVQVDEKWKKTRVIKNSSVPEWNEYFIFPVSAPTSHAEVVLYNWQRYGIHEQLGRVTVHVGMLDDNEEGTDKWYELVVGDGASVDGSVRIRTQWRRNDGEEWSPMPEIEDEEDVEEEDAEDEDLSLWGWFRHYALELAESQALSTLTIVTIFINVGTMAADHDCDLLEQVYCRGFKRDLELANLIFTCFFSVELMIKLIGLGPVNYLKDTSNLFDMIIVSLSVVELPAGIDQYNCYNQNEDATLGAKECEGGGNGTAVLRSFRLVRVLRIGKLVRAFPQIQRQLKVITKTIGAVSSLVALILLFILIFAILGMSLFGGSSMERLSADDTDYIPYFRAGAYVRILVPNDAQLQTARVLSVNLSSPEPYELEHWMSREIEHVAVAEDRNPSEFEEIAGALNQTMIVGLAPRVGFDSFFFACLTVFQLLTASDIGDVMYPAMRGSGTLSGAYFVGLIVIGNFMLFNLFVAIIITGFSETKAAILKEERENQAMIEQDKLRKAQSIARGASLRNKSIDRKSSIASSTVEAAKGFFGRVRARLFSSNKVTPDDITKAASAGEDAKTDVDEENWHDLPWMRKSVENRYFTGFIICVIVISCVSLILQRPSMPKMEADLLAQVTVAVNFIFLTECFWKIFTYGWWKYIKSRWNQLDFFLVVTSLIDMAVEWAAPSGSDAEWIRFFRTFRIFRALRPLRVISRAKGLKIVLGTVTRAIVPVMNTVAIALAVFFVFGIMAVQLLGGRTSYCTDIHVFYKEECVGVDPHTGTTRLWRARQLTYGWIGNAMLSMFVLASQDNWEIAMYAGVDATGKDTGPYANNNPVLALYFIAFMIIGSFFVIQLFVGVFIDTFQTVTSEVKALSRQSSIRSEQSSGSEMGMQEPLNKLRLYVFDVVDKKQFDLIIAAFIITNVFTMSCESYKSSAGQANFLTTVDYIFNFVFGSEVVFKLWALYPKQYFSSRWNKFDFVVVMVSFLGIAIDNVGADLALNPTILRVLRIVRIFRILRAFRIFKAAQGLQNLVRTLLRSLNAVGNLAALLLLLFFVVGVLTVELYGNLCTDDFEPYLPDGRMNRCSLLQDEDLLDYHASFKDLGMALLTLFRISTSDNWSEIMDACTLEPDGRPSGGDAIEKVKELIEQYRATGKMQYLSQARIELPVCQTAGELSALEDFVSCEYPDLQSGTCPTTCGNNLVSSTLFSFFLCASSFILLNLVMAVLMQELQNAIAVSSKSKSSLSVLMSVSAATNKWLKMADSETVDSAVAPSEDSAEPGLPAKEATADGDGDKDAKKEAKKAEPKAASSPIKLQPGSGSPVKIGSPLNGARGANSPRK